MQFKARKYVACSFAKCASFLPPESAGWLRAMFDEIEHIEGRRERVLWCAGICVAIGRLSVRKLITDNGHRPVELTVAGAYLFGFSIIVLAHLVAELLSGIREPWIEAWIPIVLCLGVSAIPAALAIGVWACDDFGRKLAVGFALLDFVVVILFARRFGLTNFRLFKFVCDLAFIATMFSPRVKNACAWRTELGPRVLKLCD